MGRDAPDVDSAENLVLAIARGELEVSEIAETLLRWMVDSVVPPSRDGKR